MQSSNDRTASLLAAYWDDQGLVLSRDLIEHDKFLLSFTPTGDIDSDLDRFFLGVGQHELLDRFPPEEGEVRALAASIRQNHREELERLARGQGPRRAGKYQRWSKEQLNFFKHLLEHEVAVLTAILEPDAVRRKAS